MLRNGGLSVRQWKIILAAVVTTAGGSTDLIWLTFKRQMHFLFSQKKKDKDGYGLPDPCAASHRQQHNITTQQWRAGGHSCALHVRE